MSYNKKEVLSRNIAAIEAALSGNRNKEVLQQYSGFGGLKCILLDPAKPEMFTRSEQNLVPLVASLHEVLRRYSKDEREYTAYLHSLQRSILTSFYTPAGIINAIDVSFREHDLSFNKMLDPSAGTGGFLAMKAGAYTAIEKDILTGKILQALHPDKDIHVSGFENISRSYEGAFDIVASNIPFGDFKVFDPLFFKSKDKVRKAATNQIHNYFFLKSSDMLREGGVMAFITSTGIMDSPAHDEIRKHLLKGHHLVSAVRLPEGTFSDAGTAVQSDLIILQKDSQRGAFLSEDEKHFLRVIHEKNGAKINSYYAENGFASIIHTRSMEGTDPYGKPALIFQHEGGIPAIAQELSQLVAKDIQKLDKSLFLDIERQQSVRQRQPIQLSLFDDFNSFISQEQIDETLKVPVENHTPVPPVKFEYAMPFRGQHTFVLSKDRTLIGMAIDERIAEEIRPSIEEKELLKDYIALREAYFSLKDYEQLEQRENATLRTSLNECYDQMVATSGNLRDNARLLYDDPSFLEIQGLEIGKNGVIEKADIFREPVAFVKAGNMTYTVQEALSLSLNKFNEVDIDFISATAGSSVQQVLRELSGQIYYNPILEKYESADVLLSGNVVEKLEHFSTCLQLEENNDEIRKACIALRDARPEKITFEEIGLNLGERWIPSVFYSRFASHIFEGDFRVQYHAALDDFFVDGESDYSAQRKYAVQSANRYYSATDVFRFALLDDMPVMTRKIHTGADPITVPDTEGIQKMNASIDLIRSEFKEWLFNLPEGDKKYLETLYNNKFNCFVKARYDGSFQTFPGLNYEGLGIKDLYLSQKNSALMLKNNGGGIIDHEVGGGKTLIMTVASYEMKRIGLINKPAILALKANVGQIADTYRKAYPDAKILCPTENDLKKDNREKFLAMIQNNNWDCIIMTHEQFRSIPQSLDIQRAILDEEIQKIEEAEDSLDKSDYKTYQSQKKFLAKRKENLEVKLKQIMFEINEKRDNVVDFKTMGIDHLFVDESHKFKNLMFTTRHVRVAGLGNSSGSDRALNLLFAIRTIQERTGKDLGATFLSGTTISNSLTELYNIFVYLRPKALEQQGIFSFDAWAATYTVKSKDFEFNVTNDIIQKERFRHFVKVPELAMFYSQITDYKTAEDIGIDRPVKKELLVDIDQTAEQQEMFERLKEFAKTGDGTLLYRAPLSDSEEKAKMLIATNTAKKAALDMRLISATFNDDSGSKVAIAANNIVDEYNLHDHVKGTQFVFCDLGTFKSHHEFSVYSALKEHLVTRGIPEKEVQFIQQHNTPNKRLQLFDKMNKGEVRVLVGSTEMLGTGVNAQKRVTAIHHLDIPWKPSELEQRDGRGVRTGNSVAKFHANNEVKVFIYAVKQSLDLYKLGLLKNKAHFIAQIKRQNVSVRTIDEGGMDEHSGMNFAEYIAVLSGDTNLLEKAKLEKRIMQLKSEETVFLKSMRGRTIEITTIREEIKRNNTILARLKEDLNRFEILPRDADGKVIFKATVQDVAYTDPKLAGEALNIAVDTENKDTVNYQEIGSFHGFKLVIRAEQSLNALGTENFQNKIFVAGDLKYSYNNGHLARTPSLAGEYAVNALNRIPGIIDQHEKTGQTNNEKLNALLALEGMTWPKAMELKSAESSLREISAKIERSLQTKSKGTDMSIG